MKNIRLTAWSKHLLILITAITMCATCLANETLYRQARAWQREGKYHEAIGAFKEYLTQPIETDNFTEEQLRLCTEALVQLMNTYQSKGDPEECIIALDEVFKTSPTLKKYCQRDFYSVKGYALSRTEKMTQAEETMFKALTLPLHYPTPERYFRDYAYAAAVFYSNPDYQDEVINWCQEAMLQAESCKNISGKQWVASMLGTVYKRNGHLNKALELYQQSAEEARMRNDDLGMLNSLHAIIDLFLYWGLPEYADLYATEALRVEQGMAQKNPMVSAQTYINKGRALSALGESESVTHYAEAARQLCQALPYNSGMVDVDLLRGSCLTESSGETLQAGIEDLQRVTREGTAMNLSPIGTGIPETR